MGQHLARFSSIQQQYGEYFAGYPWSIVGTGSFRCRAGLDRGTNQVKRYMRDLGLSIGARIPYLAVPERRTGGCGWHPIPLHFHFLAACPPQHFERFLSSARDLWAGGNGNVKVDRYDPVQHGAQYIAKLAAYPNFDFFFDHLERLTYRGATDLIAASYSNPYIPDHAKGRNVVNTLVLRDDVTNLPIPRHSRKR